MMKKSWADHCSSDEEEEDDSVHDGDEGDVNDVAGAETTGGNDDEEAAAEDDPSPTTNYDFPDRPPYTAFVGNLSFHIKEPLQLQKAVAGAVLERFGERVDVIGGRIAYDRIDPTRHRGFGYVEVDTLEQVRDVACCVVVVCGSGGGGGGVVCVWGSSPLRIQSSHDNECVPISI